METYHLMWTAQRTNQQIVAEIFRILQICQFWNFTPYLLLHLPLGNTQGNCFFLFCYLKLIIFCRKIEFSCMMSLKRLWLIVLVKAKIECTFKPNLSHCSSVLLPASIGNNSILQNRFLPFYRICSRTLSLSLTFSLSFSLAATTPKDDIEGNQYSTWIQVDRTFEHKLNQLTVIVVANLWAKCGEQFLKSTY